MKYYDIYFCFSDKFEKQLKKLNKDQIKDKNILRCFHRICWNIGNENGNFGKYKYKIIKIGYYNGSERYKKIIFLNNKKIYEQYEDDLGFIHKKIINQKKMIKKCLSFHKIREDDYKIIFR